MCACDQPNFVCARCRNTRHDPRYLLDSDPADETPLRDAESTQEARDDGK